MKITVVGCGRWGSFITWYLNKINHKVILYGRENSSKFNQLIDTRKNSLLTLNQNIELTSNLDYSIQKSKILVISIGAQSLRDFFKNISKNKVKNKIIVLCMKGIEENTGKRLTEIIEEYIGYNIPIAIWVGPGHVQDYTKGIPNCMVIDSKDQKIKEKLVQEFSSELIRFYLGKDLIGNEIGAAAKNVIGIAAGMLDGLNVSSLKGALMSRGTREISRLIKSAGGNELSAYGLCHLGDYEATLFSKHSHNRQFGENLVKNKQYNQLAEGVFTVNALLKMGEKYGVDLPICKSVYNVINKNYDPKETLFKLFNRSIKNEF